MSERKVTSTEIKIALAKYHPKDFFISECKTCSTYFPDPQGLLIFDGIGITKSYTAPCVTGYEIKVSRSDFQRDNKYHLYLQYCNEFYFVVPAGLLKKEEIPDNMGLIYYYPESGSLKKKKKAQYRQIEEPVGIYKYIIYSRIDQDRTPFFDNRMEYAKAYLENKGNKEYIGKKLGSKMAQELSDAYRRLDELKNQEEMLNLANDLIKVMNDNGIHCWCKDEYVEELSATLQNKVTSDDLTDLEKNIETTLRILKRMKKGEDDNCTIKEI